MRITEKAKQLQKQAQEFEAHPPVWAIIVVGIAVLVMIRAWRYL